MVNSRGGAGNWIIAAVAVTLALVSFGRWEKDRAGRGSAERFLTAFDVQARRPDEAATLARAPAADLSANVVAGIAVSDAFSPVRLGELSPELRGRWLRAVEKTDDELLAARRITLDAIASRPGWAGHWSALGKLVYASQRRNVLSTSVRDALEWEEPLRVAAASAPGDDSTATFLAAGYLEIWPQLSDPQRQRAIALFRRALLDPSFTSLSFLILLDAVGHQEAIALLPPVPGTLREAFQALADSRDAAGATTVYRRWEQAEWQARVSGLRAIEERSRMNDIEKQRALATDWMASHPAPDFDTEEGRQQVLRVMQLGVNDRIGVWSSDPRAAAVRFFLNRRLTLGPGAGLETAPGGTAIGMTVNALNGVPDPERARARLFAGDVYGAEALFQRSESVGSFEWTPFLLELARFRINQKLFDGAGMALDALAPAARNECDAVIVRKQLAVALGKNPSESPPAPAVQQLPKGSWTANGMLSLCVDPDAGQLQRLTTTIESDSQALLSYGWNGGRQGSMLLPAGRVFLSVPLSDLRGRNTFFVQTLAGGPARPVASRVEPLG
jgi:hypothetical protein